MVQHRGKKQLGEKTVREQCEVVLEEGQGKADMVQHTGKKQLGNSVRSYLRKGKGRQTWFKMGGGGGGGNNSREQCKVVLEEGKGKADMVQHRGKKQLGNSVSV